MRIQKLKILTLNFLLFTGMSYMANAQVTNFSDAAYDFENGSPENWTQEPGFSTSTDIVASGEKSMKAVFTEYAEVNKGPKLQAWKLGKLSNGKFDIKTGAYKMTVKVYVEGEVPSQLYVELKSALGNMRPKFEKLDRLEKNTWHTLSGTFSVEEDYKNDWASIKFVGMPKSGAGTIYIDDLDIASLN